MSVNDPISQQVNLARQMIIAAVKGDWWAVLGLYAGAASQDLWSKATNCMPICDSGTGDWTDEDKLKMFSSVYQQAGAVTNPCFYGAWTIGATAAGAGGAVVANAGEISTGIAETYPSLLHRALNWLLGRGRINPGSGAAARQVAPIIWNKIDTTCKEIQGK